MCLFCLVFFVFVNLKKNLHYHGTYRARHHTWPHWSGPAERHLHDTARALSCSVVVPCGGREGRALLFFVCATVVVCVSRITFLFHVPCSGRPIVSGRITFSVRRRFSRVGTPERRSRVDDCVPDRPRMLSTNGRTGSRGRRAVKTAMCCLRVCARACDTHHRVTLWHCE